MTSPLAVIILNHFVIDRLGGKLESGLREECAVALYHINQGVPVKASLRPGDILSHVSLGLAHLHKYPQITCNYLRTATCRDAAGIVSAC
ncbi:hypothetical protein J6590_034159 [Homalodisca vitripennis]|nr:hypothetical protein J6590_034159 [Homalodisca vitripennis]